MMSEKTLLQTPEKLCAHQVTRHSGKFMIICYSDVRKPVSTSKSSCWTEGAVQHIKHSSYAPEVIYASSGNLALRQVPVKVAEGSKMVQDFLAEEEDNLQDVIKIAD